VADVDISGTWYNELNSTMQLKVTGKEIRGWYISAVGDAAGPYDLIGYLDPDDATPTVGWTVVWKNETKHAQAVTTWCGQAQQIDDEDVIDTTWLLTRSTAVRDDWESTMLGKDLFRRVKASDEEVRKAKMIRGVK
jgi:hypothetical protein